jgi:hypothetical protein
MLLTGLTGDFDSEVLRLRYSSMTTPPSVYDQHMATGEAFCWQRVWPAVAPASAAPSEFNTSDST